METSRAIWTIPNLISVVRIVLVAVFGALLVAEQDGWAIVVLAAAGVSDFLDGFLARRWGQVTQLGRILDPTADRLLTIVVVLGLLARDIIPWWLVLVLLARDVMVGVVLLYGWSKRVRSPHVTYVGKAATAALYVFFPLAYVSFERVDVLHTIAIVGASLAAVVYWWAGVGYVRDVLSRVADSARAAEESDASPA
ncbi:CDP-alcohol phosphatidyltransferase family protein [Demequina zhanjiangensis]|uniref:CDP-alcohol phosphatidyltransferase family protein n=1 Tax=Demequina zhanjiangensis TaxID=3051659 RepID=A0ABT8G2F2_9MICO|nr:CDP-alcohol phosphatidyltransferase family protein [Demequina sp. SYSU T00b26]MDN4473300.1 CDP-alcohol phosphatidyltransferase family protein [Demequina sp. SYSU T00b26]